MFDGKKYILEDRRSSKKIAEQIKRRLKKMKYLVEIVEEEGDYFIYTYNTWRDEENVEYRCDYCGKTVEMKELRKVDEKMGNIRNANSELIEFISDELPEEKVSWVHDAYPYSHSTEDGDHVLNLCNECFKKAFKKSGVGDELDNDYYND